jgi:hypothetical protein
MVANESDGLDWLVARIKWENTLRSLHDRSRPGRASDEVAPVPNHCTRIADPGRKRPSRLRASVLLRSPIRGMSRRVNVIRLRT